MQPASWTCSWRARCATQPPRGLVRFLVGGSPCGGSSGVTSFLTGITEPIEFSFLFLAPLRYAAHAVLSGPGVGDLRPAERQAGLRFSAGLIDYLVNYQAATNTLLVIPLG